MDFDQWRIGNTYTPFELTQIIRDGMKECQTCFAYNSCKSLSIQKANVKSEICSLEEFVNKKFTSLELEFMRRSPAAPKKREMIYLWLKFIPQENDYRLSASIKSRSNLNYLRQKPLNYDWGWDV